MRISPYLAGALMLAGCNASPEKSTEKTAAVPATSALEFETAKSGAPFAETPTLQAQVILDRLGFSPGVIDGEEGQSYIAALRGFQVANELKESGKLDEATLTAMNKWRGTPATRLVVIPEAFAKGPFIPDFPSDAAQQAKLPALGYKNLIEALAERFHTTPEAIVALNSPSTPLGAGKTIRVPNIPNVDAKAPADDARGWHDRLQRLGVSPTQPKAEKVVVDKSEGVLKVYGADDRLIAQFPATMGSEKDPLPIGDWKIQGVSRNPDFHYNPKLFWDVSDNKEAQLLQPGPNSPVGVVWIDLNKPHYGIHGTSEPHTIGRAESHGCIRLTNWDGARLAQMVKPGTPAKLQP